MLRTPFLAMATVAAVEEFYRELDDFRLYLSFTQDMPASLSDQYGRFLHRLAAYGAQAIEALGGAPERPLIEFDEDGDGTGHFARDEQGEACEGGLDHDATPLQFELPYLKRTIDVGFYSRKREINAESSFSVLG